MSSFFPFSLRSVTERLALADCLDFTFTGVVFSPLSGLPFPRSYGVAVVGSAGLVSHAYNYISRSHILFQSRVWPSSPGSLGIQKRKQLTSTLTVEPGFRDQVKPKGFVRPLCQLFVTFDLARLKFLYGIVSEFVRPQRLTLPEQIITAWAFSSCWTSGEYCPLLILF